MTCSDSLNQLRVLLWKSWKTLIRSKWWLIAQFVITLLLWVVVVYIMRNVKDGIEQDRRMAERYPYKERDTPHTYERWGIGYKCMNEGTCAEVTQSMTLICERLKQEQSITTETKKLCSLRSMNDHQEERPSRRLRSKILAIREFSESSIDIDYYEACRSHELPSQQFKELSKSYESCEGPSLFRLLAIHSGKMTNMAVKFLKPIGFKPDVPDEYYWILATCAVPIIFFCAQVTLEVSQEAVSLIKDYLLSVGMSRILYFSHHLIFHFLKSWIVVVGCSIILGWAYESAMLAVYIFFISTLALAAWISIALLIGSCFKKPGIAAFVTLLALICMTLCSILLTVNRTNPLGILYCLIPNMALKLILDAKYEAGLRGQNVWFAEVTDVMPQGYFILMLLFDTFFYFFLAILADLIRSSFENPISLMRRSKTNVEEESKSLGENRETSDRQMKAELVIEGVHKMYSTGEYAVRGINMRMYKGQVTALLGHNGAGKSTTFSMISGMTVPTKGRIQIGDDESKVGRQKLIGFCPQYNAIFPKLTVDEHLHFFAKLKGVDSTNGDAVLSALGMSDKGKALAATLSGGMKRKLCIAIAFAADSPIILLDEPTAGMDTGARRDFERLLLERKKEHTILLTTHYTDEAEMLADRIIIMARGKVFCSGSAQFLRKKFDSGFILSFAVENESDTDKALDEMMKIATEFVPDVSVYKKRVKQFEFKLSTDDTSRFCEMFRKIESNGKSVGLQSYGLSMNKLEQVFLKVGELTGTVDRSAEVDTAMKALIQENEKRSEGACKVLKQFGNCLLKRVHFEMAHIASLVFSILLLFAMTYLLFAFAASPNNGAKSQLDDSKSLLTIEDSYRIGIDSTLHANFDEIKRKSALFGKRFTIVECSSIIDWYKTTGNSRPPILGGLSKVDGVWTIYAHERNDLHLPTLEAIAAMVNNPDLKKVNFDYKKEEEHERRSLYGQDRVYADGTEIVLFMLLPMFTTLMFYRPVSFLIAERVSNFGHQQRLTGVARLTTVLSAILYDFIIFLLHFACFLGAALAGGNSLARLHLGALIYTPFLGFWCGELSITLLSRLFVTPAMGQVTILFLMNLSVVLAFVLGNYSHACFLILSPTMALGEYNIERYQDDVTGMEAALLVSFHCAAVVILFIIFEFGLIDKWRRRGNKQEQPNEEEGKPAGDSLVLRVNNMNKWYGKKDAGGVHAVKGITFGVRAHECFGVLGINGAGKSSTFEVLTGNARPDEGSATVGGVDCGTPATIGYCPQIDALIEDLTGRQSLVILAALHGYDNPRYVADIVITCVGMQDNADKRSKTYSGGQRRKISVAASLLAQNSLIILDEPTAGIDPIARRDIWSVICALRESTNTAIVLTSHSMDEVEALVGNLIILREGSIVVEGSPQMIKNQYGDHYNFNLIMENVTDVGQITAQVLACFPAATLHDSASLRNIKYWIPRSHSDVFSVIFERATTIAKQLAAADFSFTQATLEDAFMRAATAKPEADQSAPLPVVLSVDKESPKVVEATATDHGNTTTVTESPTQSVTKTQGNDVV